MGWQDSEEGDEVHDGHLVHSQKVRLGLTDEISLKGGKVCLLDQIALSPVVVVPVEELVELGALERVLGVPLIVDDFGGVDKPQNGDDSTDKSCVLTEGTFPFQDALVLVNGEVLRLGSLLQHLDIFSLAHWKVGHVDEAAEDGGLHTVVEFSIHRVEC